MNLNNINYIIYSLCKEYPYNKTVLVIPRKYTLNSNFSELKPLPYNSTK